MAGTTEQLAAPLEGPLDDAPIKHSPEPDQALDFRLVELLFFAYRDFISDADEKLADYQFGRAHHRVLHFVNRHPGLSVAKLLDILRITKQSLGPVLRQLVESGHLVQEAGNNDRRQRLLFPTQKGRNLSVELAQMQSERIKGALAPLAAEDRTCIEMFLFGMIEPEERELVRGLVRSVDAQKPKQAGGLEQ